MVHRVSVILAGQGMSPELGVPLVHRRKDCFLGIKDSL